MQVPRLEKIAINIGVGQATQDPKLVDAAAQDLELIAGQKVVITRAKKSISNFKLREKMPIGCRVTLRRAHMYEFLDRFISIAVPRIRDFRGLSDKSFDGRGNYTIGIKEHTVFPEIDVDKIARVFGMDITIRHDGEDRPGGLRAAEGVRHAVREAAGSSRTAPDNAKKESPQPWPNAFCSPAKRSGKLVRKYAAIRKELKAKGTTPPCSSSRGTATRPRLHNRCSLSGRPAATCGSSASPASPSGSGARRENPRRHEGELVSARNVVNKEMQL